MTPELLDQAKRKWQASKPAAYSMTVVMQGDRVERGEYEVDVQGDKVTNFKRNGLVLDPASGHEYSMDGLFRILEEEVDLAKTPASFGAPSGYSAYLLVSFDATSGALQHYRRSVGGISNSIDIEVLKFQLPSSK